MTKKKENIFLDIKIFDGYCRIGRIEYEKSEDALRKLDKILKRKLG